MRRVLTAMICVFSVITLLTSVAFAEEPSFSFELSIDGLSEVDVAKGDVVTVVLRLKRTDCGDDFTMHAMQDEVAYDPSFFRLVPDGTLTREGVRTADVAASDGRRAFLLSFVSFDGGEVWEADTLVGMFQLEVIGDSGAAALENTRFLVSKEDGSSQYDATAQDVTVAVSDMCTVQFIANGVVVDTQTVPRGSKLSRPDAPEQEGYRLSGWCRDAALTQPWDFDRDTVTLNTTLYAAYEPVESAPTALSPLWLLLLLPVIGVVIVWRRRGK